MTCTAYEADTAQIGFTKLNNTDIFTRITAPGQETARLVSH
jgi:hypothetical protein